MSGPPPREDTLGVAIVGLGFMGQTHVRAFRGVQNARLIAVCDHDASRLDGRARGAGNIDTVTQGEQLFDPGEVRGYIDLAAMLADERIDAVSICTHTGTHAEIALAAIAAGKHVLIEKPVSLDPAEIESLDVAARRARVVAMPAMCMRFWPGWSWLKERIDAGDLGRVVSATFHRLGSRPSWGTGFYDDEAKSGGALFDLHIHDTDVVRWLFGEPIAACSTGTTDHLTTLYRFERGPTHIVAEGGWGHRASFGFRMRYVVVFEKGVAEFDLSRDTPLVLHDDTGSHTIPLPSGTGYDGEARAFVHACIQGDSPPVTLADTAAVTRLLLAERESVRTRREIIL
ncbi:MAG: Gfo/Idh/MocA family oxidoreductase [Phycisphaerales bacterium]|jgi:predicted dehydrogenase|nr:Gfo/Idh/MocA family oxidoreductase [Phycisphaerales bacterium]